MKIARVLWTVGLAIAVIVSLISAPTIIKELVRPSRPGGDDQPVMMAGGSLYVGTGHPGGFYFDRNQKHIEINKPNHQVTKIDGVYVKPGNAMSDAEEKPIDPPLDYTGKPIKIDFEYCKNLYDPGDVHDPNNPSNPGSTNKCDHVILETVAVDPPGAQTIKISADRRFGPILPNLVRHARRQWTLTRMHITDINAGTSQGYGCMPVKKPGEIEAGECWLEIHYCDVTNGCVPTDQLFKSPK